MENWPYLGNGETVRNRVTVTINH